MALVALAPAAAWAQLVIQDNFTGPSSSFNWQSFRGACLTAGNNTGNIPACVGLSYYTEQLVGGSTGLLPDPAGSGALRFTNGRPGGNNQNGAIVSNFTFPTDQGLHVTFTTATYRGDSGGAGADGADGISFYLMDGSKPPGIGAFGGSLAYTCSNANTPHDGLVGGYIGLGIDEFGNFLNGAQLMPGYAGTNVASGDNTQLGYGYHPGRIGLRGAGSIAFSALNTLNSAFYPATLSAADQQAAVQSTCSSGTLWDYSNPAKPKEKKNTTVADYAPILNAYKELPAGFLIANEGAQTRGAATPITYDLKITPAGLLSLSYSYNGGASQLVINGQDITATNGALPGTFRFGFAGSTGGNTNIHEILCFKATPFEQSSSSAGLNQQQASQVNTGTQVYLAFFDPSNWSGSLTSQNVLYNASTQTVSISSIANWDASCVLTGVAAGRTCAATGVSGATTAEAPANRVIMTWNGSSGIPFEWASLTGAQQNTLDAGDAAPFNANRLNYLRGVRTNEQNAMGVGLFGARVSVLSDIVDSSPTPVGPPTLRYPASWSDFLISSPSLPENSGQSYSNYATAQKGRLNVVYAGANDGFLHAFRSGSFDSNGNFVNNAGTPNDGYELMSYMPGAVLNSIHNAANPALDFANIQYGHNFYVDATPGNGDLFYGGLWHTWLVGGLGPGGSAIYALDVTNPSTAFTEGNAANVVIGEWNPATLTCTNVASCGNNLGNTYGTPQIRRFHNGMWGAVFGNGFGSASGDAGIYIMIVDSTSGARTFYYLSAGKAGTSDGIAYASPADIDGDHVVDYVYAGDLLGNLWRFDLTSNNPALWALSTPAPLFKTPAGQPITTQVVPLVTSQTTSLPRVMVDFGTGRQIPLTNASPTTYATGSQALYGIWDWNMSSWNLIAAQKFASLPAPQSVTVGTLSAQTVLGTFTSAAGNQFRTISSNPVCWSGSATCASSSNNQFGWSLNLPGAAEQVIFNPSLQLGVFLVNTTIPPSTDPYQCLATTTSGWTFGISPSNGGTFATSTFGDDVNNFNTYNNQVVGAENTNGTGSASVVLAGGHSFLVMQTSSPGSSGGSSGGSSSGGSSGGSSGAGSPGTALPFNGPNPNSTRVTWVERR